MSIYHTAGDRTPYTYLIGWTSINKWYYGVRYRKKCHPSDLWVKYFTSSKYVKKIRDMYGEPDVVQVRKIFSNPEKAFLYEQRVLQRLDILNNDKWLNCAIGGTHNNPGNHTTRSQIQKESASALAKTLYLKYGGFSGRSHTKETLDLMKGPKSKEHSKNISLGKKGIPQRKAACQYCNRNIGISNLKRHTDKCKKEGSGPLSVFVSL